jgi:hypothetical protein
MKTNQCSGVSMKRRIGQLICALQKRSYIIACAATIFLPLMANAKLNVVTSTPELAAITREIGGDQRVHPATIRSGFGHGPVCHCSGLCGCGVCAG